MNQDRVGEKTQKAIEASLEFTNRVIKQSKKLQTPSPKTAHIGSMIGSGVGVGLLVVGATQLLLGKTLWAASSLSAGTLTVISNVLYHKKRNEK